MANAVSTPTTKAALRCRAVRTDARTLTCTTTTAVRAASTAALMSANLTARLHATPAATPALATVPSSVDVGGVHDTAVRHLLPPSPQAAGHAARRLGLHDPTQLLGSAHQSEHCLYGVSRPPAGCS